MDEIIEELLDRAEAVPVPLDLPTEDDIIDVVEQILLPLPRDYHEFLMSVSHVVYGSIEPATAADPMSHTYLPELCSVAWSLGAPRHLIIICQAGRQYYCLDPDGGICLWQEKGGFQEGEWENIWEWARDVWLNS